MSYEKEEKPKTTTSNNNLEDYVTTHPAFGMVTVNRLSTNRGTLFASDLNHHELIRLSVYQGETVSCDGSIRQRRASRAMPLVEITLSPAQWAAMITSFGIGDGVPCTLNYIRDGKPVRLPEIIPDETTRQRFDRQIIEATKRQTEKLNESLKALSSLVSKGKAGKKELEKIYRQMASQIGNLPANLAFTSTLMQEQMDGIVASGKAELEATALGVAMRLGVKTMNQLIEIEDKS